MICPRRAPISFMTPICGTCCVISADIALTTRKPESSRMTRPKAVRISTTLSMKGSATLSVMTCAAVTVRPESFEVGLDLVERGQDVRLVLRWLGGANPQFGVQQRRSRGSPGSLA